MKKITAIGCILLLLFAFGCSDDDSTTANDSRLIGRWEGMMGDQKIVVKLTATEMEYLVFKKNPESQQYDLTGESSKGSYTALNGEMTPDNSHMYDTNSNAWVAVTNQVDKSGYSFVEGTTVALITNAVNPDLYLTNTPAYSSDTNLNGTWRCIVTNSDSTIDITLEVADGSSFTMTQKISSDSITNVTNEVATGSILYNAASGWIEVTLDTKRSLDTNTMVLSDSESTFEMNMSHIEFNADKTQFVKDGLMTFTKISAPGDPAVIGQWQMITDSNAYNAVFDGENYMFRSLEKDSQSGIYRLVLADKGKYHALGGQITFDMQYMINTIADQEDWTPVNNKPNIEGYSVTNENGTNTLKIVDGGEFPECVPYVTNDQLAGTWTNTISMGTGTNETWTMIASNDASFSMTVLATAEGHYTNLTKEISYGDSLTSTNSTAGWMQTLITSRRSWDSEGSATLGAAQSVYDFQLMEFTITNDGTYDYLVLGNGQMYFVKPQ